MTLRMADGYVANLPAGLDAYAGYVNDSGDGVTYPGIVARFPDAEHLSITTNGSPAECADVERGAMSSWTGYQYGYCSVSSVNANIAQFGRPPKLWTAHYNGIAHICSPACWPGLVTTADGTQWTDHSDLWDESLLLDNFFGAPKPPPPPPITYPVGAHMQTLITIPTDAQGNGWVQTSVPWPILALFHRGSDPAPTADATYWPGSAHAQDRGNCALVSVTGCLPLSDEVVFITHD